MQKNQWLQNSVLQFSEKGNLLKKSVLDLKHEYLENNLFYLNKFEILKDRVALVKQQF